MRNLLAPAVSFGVGTALVFAFLPGDPVASQETPTRVIQKWEYQVVARDVDDLAPQNPQDEQTELNNLGDEGWELCATIGPATNRGVRFVQWIFKRPGS